MGSDGYECNHFLLKEHNDLPIAYFYSVINKFIRFFFKPFPHQALVSRKTLEGNWSDFEQSLPKTYRQWLDYESWWIAFGASIIITSLLFSVLFIFYSTVKCCAIPNKKKTAVRHRDSCKQRMLNVVIAVFVIIDVFAVSSLLVSSQYALYGVDELPYRLGHCVDDLSIYKKDTDQKIRSTLIGEFQGLNESLSVLLASGGGPVVKRVKKITGAYAMDSFLNISLEAQEVLKQKTECEQRLEAVNVELLSLRSELSRFYRASIGELYDCVQNESEMGKRRCQEVEGKLSDISNMTFGIQQNVMSSDTKKALMLLAESNIDRIFAAAASDFKYGEIELNEKVLEKQQAVQLSVGEIQDELIRIADALSSQIRQIKPEVLHDVLKQYTGPEYHNIIQYTWCASLTLCAIFSLKALYFLFALCYGCFGSRPDDYRNDCCVRSTGGKLFSCGIWLAVVLLPVMSAVTASLLFIGVNAYSLACWPLDDPFSRPDMLSFGERMLDAWRSKQTAENLSPLLNQMSLSDIIRSCTRNETLYEIFAMDNKYHLYDLREYGRELYDRLEHNIEAVFSDMNISRPIAAFASPSQLLLLQRFFNITIKTNIQQISFQIKNNLEQLDKIPRVLSLLEEEEVDEKLPRAIQTVTEQLRNFQMRSVNSVQQHLADVLKILTKLKDRLTRITLPGATLSAKLQHAQALLASNLNKHFRAAADQLVHEIEQQIDNYIEHVRMQMSTNVTSCDPLFSIVTGTHAALCQCSIDPFNGVWASMVISILCTIPLIVMGSTAASLYRKNSHPKYTVHEPNVDVDGTAGTFPTDFYNRSKQTTTYLPSAYAICYNYPQPYLRSRS